MDDVCPKLAIKSLMTNEYSCLNSYKFREIHHVLMYHDDSIIRPTQFFTKMYPNIAKYI